VTIGESLKVDGMVRSVLGRLGEPRREPGQQRAGHSRPSMSLDVYTHVMPVEEIAEEQLAAVLV
jgi:hypothetical protein